MKKTILTFLVSILMTTWAAAGVENYSLPSSDVDALFASSEDITLSLLNEGGIESMHVAGARLEGDKSVGGFLIRNFFCGGIALHRYYMGTGGKTMWARYLCIPVVGPIAACGDFFYVLFEGEEALNKYKDNGDFFVW